MDKFQDEVVVKTNEITKSAIVNGVLILGVSINTVSTTVEHGLNRDVVGFIVINKSVFADTATISSDKRKLVIKSSVNFTADLWVF